MGIRQAGSTLTHSLLEYEIAVDPAKDRAIVPSNHSYSHAHKGYKYYLHLVYVRRQLSWISSPVRTFSKSIRSYFGKVREGTLKGTPNCKENSPTGIGIRTEESPDMRLSVETDIDSIQLEANGLMISNSLQISTLEYIASYNTHAL
jgi:hypothetical protein